jgi:hypothetical protein
LPSWIRIQFGSGFASLHILFYILASVGDEEENRFLAKRKMLGNIKFIGELGKLEMLHDSILHRCCEQASSSIRE